MALLTNLVKYGIMRQQLVGGDGLCKSALCYIINTIPPTIELCPGLNIDKPTRLRGLAGHQWLPDTNGDLNIIREEYTKVGLETMDI